MAFGLTWLELQDRPSIAGIWPPMFLPAAMEVLHSAYASGLCRSLVNWLS